MENTQALRGNDDAEALLAEVYAAINAALAEAADLAGYFEAMRAVLSAAQRSDSQGYRFSLLPLLACRAAGGELARALPAAAAWRALHIAAKLYDDVEDGDVESDGPRVINIATGFTAVAFMCLERGQGSGAAVEGPGLSYGFARAVLEMSAGQHADLGLRRPCDAEDCLRIADAKSGAFFALACWAGARCAAAEPAAVACYQAFGRHVGVFIQLADDRRSFRTLEPGCDLLRGRYTLPVCYGLDVVPDAARPELEGYLARAGGGDEEAARQAQRILRALGADVFLQAEMARYLRRAQSALKAASQAGGQVSDLAGWLARVAGPGWERLCAVS